MAEESKKNQKQCRTLSSFRSFWWFFASGMVRLFWSLPQGPGAEGPLGPSFVPWVWAALLVVLTLVDIGTDYLGKAQDKAHVAIERKGVFDALILCLMLAGLALLMQYVGFSAAVIAFLAVSIWWSGIRALKIIIPYVVIFALVVNYVFHRVLQVPLPQDWLF